MLSPAQMAFLTIPCRGELTSCGHGQENKLVLALQWYQIYTLVSLQVLIIVIYSTFMVHETFPKPPDIYPYPAAGEVGTRHSSAPDAGRRVSLARHTRVEDTANTDMCALSDASPEDRSSSRPSLSYPSSGIPRGTISTAPRSPIPSPHCSRIFGSLVPFCESPEPVPTLSPLPSTDPCKPCLQHSLDTRVVRSLT